MDKATIQTKSVSRRPRVGLNAHLLSLSASYRGAGVSHYIASLLSHLPAVERDLELVAFLDQAAVDSAALTQGWERHVSLWGTGRPTARILWEQFAQPISSRRARLDLLHAPVYVGPIAATCPLVVTLHDLAFFRYPELFRPPNRLYLQRMTSLSVRRAAHVIAVSESTRTDAQRLLGIPEERITVVPNGVDDDMRPIDDAQSLRALRQRYALPEQIILFVGTLEPRKNLPVLLEAYALLRARGLPHKLVIAGGKGWYYDTIDAGVRRLGLAQDVIFPGFVPQDELPLWYNAAELFVYPSLYEGFGLPPLEAMACGTPVVVSDVPALAEVVGEAGLRVAPDDVQGLSDAMYRVLNDPLYARHLREAGCQRAHAFSWSTTALRTAQVYHHVLGAT
ncbi:MAG: glycosyltransferase family 4 protein [Anaerolineae bacterium]